MQERETGRCAEKCDYPLGGKGPCEPGCGLPGGDEELEDRKAEVVSGGGLRGYRVWGGVRREGKTGRERLGCNFAISAKEK